MDPSQGWIEALASLRTSGTPCAMVVVADVKGSTPRELGARMLVARERVHWGTIGGGKLEHLALAKATELLAGGEALATRVDVPLAETAGQCCGGHVSLLIEVYPWRRRTVVVFGAGHVGQALAGLGDWMRAEVVVVDPRPERSLVPTPPGERAWTLRTEPDPVGEVDTIPSDAAVLVMTHSHDLDLDVLAAALRRGTFPYLGLIGSERKWKRFRARLSERGFDDAALDGVTTPIGVVRGSKEPGAIALSAATQLVELFDRAPA